MTKRGWHRESARHSLSARGVKTRIPRKSRSYEASGLRKVRPMARIKYTSAWEGVGQKMEYIPRDELPEGNPDTWSSSQWQYVREVVLRGQASDAHPIHIKLEEK